MSSNRSFIRIGLIVGIGCSIVVAIGVYLSTQDTAGLPIQGTTSNDRTATAGPVEESAPTPRILGATRSQPLPVDAVIDIGGGMEMYIINVLRPANDVVQQAHFFNDTPEPNLEYVMVMIRVTCNKPGNERCLFSTVVFKTVGKDGQVRDQPYADDIPEFLEAPADFFGGDSVEGNLVFLVPQEDHSAVLYFDPLYIDNPTYIALQ